MPSPRGHRRPAMLAALLTHAALSFSQQGINLLMLPLYLHYVPAEEIGVMAAVMAAAALVGVVANLKLDSAMRAFYFDHHEDSEATTSLLRQVFSASIITASLVYLVLLPLGGPIFALVFAHDTVTYFPAGALAVGTAALNACLATYFVYLRNRLLLAELARWQMGILAATACLQATLLIGFDLGVNGILWGALCPVAMALLLLVIIRPGLLSARLDAKMVGPCLRFSLPLVGLGVIYALGTRFDRLLLERHVALAELGAYAVLMSLFALVRIVLTILDDACRPYLYPALKAGDLAHERFQRLYFLVGLAAVSTVVFAGAYLNLLTEDPAYLATRGWLPLAALAVVPLIFTRYISLHFEFHKRSTALSAAVILRVTALLALLSYLVPRFGVTGALAGLLVAETLNALALWATARCVLGVMPPLRAVCVETLLLMATIVVLSQALRGASAAAFGAMQLVAVAGLLAATNARSLLEVVSAHDVHADMP